MKSCWEILKKTRKLLTMKASFPFLFKPQNSCLELHLMLYKIGLPQKQLSLTWSDVPSLLSEKPLSFCSNQCMKTSMYLVMCLNNLKQPWRLSWKTMSFQVSFAERLHLISMLGSCWPSEDRLLSVVLKIKKSSEFNWKISFKVAAIVTYLSRTASLF